MEKRANPTTTTQPIVQKYIPNPRRFRIARNLCNLPVELVHQVMSDLTLTHILEVLCIVPALSGCVATHPLWRKFLFNPIEVASKLNQITTVKPEDGDATHLTLILSHFALYLNLIKLRRKILSQDDIDKLNFRDAADAATRFGPGRDKKILKNINNSPVSGGYWVSVPETYDKYWVSVRGNYEYIQDESPAHFTYPDRVLRQVKNSCVEIISHAYS